MLIPWFRVVLWQLGAVGTAGLVGVLVGGGNAMLAVLYGGAVAVANQVLLMWRWHAGSRDYHCDAQKHLKGFYRSSMERFFVVSCLLVLWFVLVKSEPLAMLTGFLIGQFAGMAANLALRERV
jgi:hypothetical protein